MLQAELKILGGKHQGKLIPLNTKKFLVGREQDCHLRPNSDLVSRHHCVFSIDDYSIRLRDLGSTNGTLVNGSNLRGEVILKSGDQVTIGKLELEVVIRQSFAKAAVKPSILPPIAPIASPVLTPDEMPTHSEEVETNYELATYPAEAPVQAAPELPADTAIIGSGPPQYLQPPPPGYPQMMPPGYPMPGAYGQPPGYGQPMGYPMGYMPPQYPQYPPGYGQPYPQMMPQGYPGVAMAAPPVAVSVPEPEPEAPAVLAVRLPNPEETGAKPAAPPAAPGAAGAVKEEKPSTTAADIIKQYMNRRT